MVRVLIADGRRDTLMTLSILLRSEGMDVRLVDKGAEVERAVDEFRPDVVLLDIEMPDRSGLQVALDLGSRGLHGPALIAMTAHDGEIARRLTAKSGFLHHVSKPYDPEALLKLIASVGHNALAK
jgi:DNA-binding response OmpR family regulator